MRARWLLPAMLLVALSAAGLAGDGANAPAAPAKPAVPQKAEKPVPPKEKSPDPKPATETKTPAKVVAVPARPAPKDLDDALRRLARVKVNVRFDEAPFADVVGYLRVVAGFNVIVSPALQMKGADGIKPITLTLSDVSLRTVAEFVAQFSGTKLKVESGILQFTTPEDARGKPVLRIYSIGDVTMPLRNFPGPDLNLRPSSSDFEEEAETEVASAWGDPQKIVDLIQKTVAEETWGDKDVSISADEHKLIVRQYPEVQRQIARLVALLRASR